MAIDFDFGFVSLEKRSLLTVPAFVVGLGRMATVRSEELWAAMVNMKVVAHPIEMLETIAIVGLATAVADDAAADDAAADDECYCYFARNAGLQCIVELLDLVFALDLR